MSYVSGQGFKVNTLKTFGDLQTFHNEIISQKAFFIPDPELFRLFDVEYLNHMSSENECYYCWLALAVRILQPRHILELGAFAGGSAVCLFQELASSSKLTSVDVKKDLRFCPPEMLEDHRISFVFGNDLDLSIFGEGIPLDIDFLFLDTLHDYKQISNEWAIYQHLLQDGAMVVLDDIRLNNMPRFWEELPYDKYEATKDCHSSGFGIFIFHREIEMDEEERLDKAHLASRKALSSPRIRARRLDKFMSENKKGFQAFSNSLSFFHDLT